MTQLIIAEKTSAAQKIAEALADKKPIHKINKAVSYYELTHKGKKIIVGCAVGHLFNLREKEKTQDYPNFDIEWAPSYTISKSATFTKKYFDALTKLIKEADEFVNACDWDTEGELIFETIRRFLIKKPDAKRMHFSTLTKPDLIEAYENLSPHLDKELAESGEARHFLDHFWGINSSKALTSSIKKAGQFKILSSGRVQSPTLTLLAHREIEIQNFKPEPYWQLLASIEVKNHLLEAIHEKGKFWQEKEAKEIFEKCKTKHAKIIKITKKEQKVNPPTPFNITTLQTEAYRLFKFSPKQTLDIAQSLYLAAYISYPRTSSEKLDPKIGYKNILKTLSKFKEFKEPAIILLSKTELKPTQGKRTDQAHIAIYPTESPPKSLLILTDQQRKIYTLIVKRFLSVFAEPAIREIAEIKFDINKEIFITQGARTLTPGWIYFYQPFFKFKETTLPVLNEGEIHIIRKLELKKDETKPPKRYTQGSIIAMMEKRGLGTRATRSQILQILYDRNYIQEKSIKVTKLGMAVSTTLEKYVPDLVSEKLTRYFEGEMEQIQQGKKKKEIILKEAQTVIKKISNIFKKNEEKIGESLLKATRETQKEESLIGKCNLCNENLRIMYSKKNKSYFIACSNYPKCKNTFSLPFGLPKPSGKICESCKFPIVLIIRKGKRPYEFCLNKECPKKEEWFNNH